MDYLTASIILSIKKSLASETYGQMYYFYSS